MVRSDTSTGSVTAFALLVLSLSLPACATVRPEPFTGFATSVQELQKGADAALAANDASNRERFVEEAVRDLAGPEGEEAVNGLLIEGVDGQPFGWKMGREPLFMASRRFRTGVHAVNGTLVGYADLLAQLAAPELVSRAQFDAMARSLDANLTAGATALEIDGAEQGLAIFSVVATTAAHAYIEHRRQGELRDALENNQGNIAEISAKLQKAMGIAARNLRQNYDQQSLGLALKLTPDAPGGAKARRANVEALIALNEFYVMRLSSLETLNSSYAALPTAHRELIAAIARPDGALSAIRQLYANGKHLQNLTKELSAPAAPSTERAGGAAGATR